MCQHSNSFGTRKRRHTGCTPDDQQIWHMNERVLKRISRDSKFTHGVLHTTSANEAPPVARHGAPVGYINVNDVLYRVCHVLTENASQKSKNHKTGEVIHNGCGDPEDGKYEECYDVWRIPSNSSDP